MTDVNQRPNPNPHPACDGCTHELTFLRCTDVCQKCSMIAFEHRSWRPDKAYACTHSHERPDLHPKPEHLTYDDPPVLVQLGYSAGFHRLTHEPKPEPKPRKKQKPKPKPEPRKTTPKAHTFVCHYCQKRKSDSSVGNPAVCVNCWNDIKTGFTPGTP